MAYSAEEELSGVDLFRSDVITVLEHAENHEVIYVSGKFKSLYKEIFGERFCPYKYGFESKSLCSYFNQIGDIIRFKNIDGKLAIFLKEKKTKLSKTDCKKARFVSVGEDVNEPRDESNGSAIGASKCLPFDDMKGNEEQWALKNTLSGIELFKSHLQMILEDTTECKVDVSRFKQLYKHKFMCPFIGSKYGLLRGKLSKVLQLESLSDLISLENEGSALFVKLNDGAKLLTRHSKESRDHECSDSEILTNYQQLQAGLVESFCEDHTELEQVPELQFVEGKANDVKLNVVCNEDHSSLPSLFEQTGVDNEASEAEEGSSLRPDLHVPSQNIGEKAEKRAARKARKQAELNLFRNDVIEVLLNVEGGKIEMNKFADYYEQTFNGTFTRGKYNFPKKKKIDKVFKKMSDVVSLELVGDVFFIKLNDSYKGEHHSDKEEKLKMPFSAKDHPMTLKPLEPMTVPSLQTAVQQQFKEESQRATSHQLSVEGKANNVRSTTVCNDNLSFPDLFEQITAVNSDASVAKNDGTVILLPQAASSVAKNDGTIIQLPQAAGVSKKPDVELFKQEVRSILLQQGQVLVSQFANLYESTFNAKFRAEKYKFEKKRKFKSLLEQISDVVSLESEGKFLFMKLNNDYMYLEEQIEKQEIGNIQHTPKDQQMTLDCHEFKTRPSLQAAALQQQLDRESSTAIAPQPLMKKKGKDMISDSVCKQSLLSRPSPFEDSFNLSQSVQPAPTMKRRCVYTPHEVNELAKQEIKNIADEGHYVSLELVKAKMCEIIGLKSLKDMRYKNPDIEIPELKELQRLHSKLDLYARAYVMVHSISTLSEIGQSMARLLEKRDFLELRVGPLVKQPVIFDLFKAPSDGSAVHQITTLQVLKNLNQYLTKEEKWTSKVKLQDFLQYLCDEYDCETPYELGVRVQSVGLGISVLKRSQKAQSERSKKVEEEITADLEKEFERRCKKIKDDLLGSSQKDERSIINKLLGTPVVDVLMKVFDHCSVIYQNAHTVNQHDIWIVEQCLETFVKKKSLRNFFNLALYLGCKEIVQELLDECKEEMIEMNELKESQKKEKAVKPPKKRSLIHEVKQWLNSAEDLSLSTLVQIEGRVTDQFPGFPNFVSFGYGTFLEFLTKEAELCKILEERGTSLCGVAVSHRQADSKGVLDFVRQCGSQVSQDALQRTLCDYYHVNTITELGFRSFDDLMSEMSRNKPQHSPRVHYESAILCKDDMPIFAAAPNPYNSAEPRIPKAGLSGVKNPEEAVVALKSAPLLADMMEYTQWSTVFEPCLGNLKQFIEEQDNHNKSDLGCKIEALETNSKALLRIDPNATPEEFYKCVDEEDVIGASGTLVSLVVKYGGIKATPLTMLTNHMRPALSKLVYADRLDGGSRCPRFVLHCLCRIPHNISMALALKVFLEPLGSAVGTTNSSPLLLSCCNNHEERSRLHQLGLRLGKTELIKDFEASISGKEKVGGNKEKINLKDLKPVAYVKPVCPVEQVTIDVEESQEENSDDSDDLSFDDEQEQVENEDSESASEDEEAAIIPNPYKAIIDSIRKEEFGIGVVLGEEGEKLAQKQREREGRSLHRLSAELYNRDTHFVLELVQNADDNTYMDETPALMFVVDSKRIVVLNNEVGFSEKNIRALCDVGKSTKGPHQYGYIGQKGIGFKSVFRISDIPEVHSNGYHIRFDANSGPSGYILPHWIEHAIKGMTAGQDDCSSVLVEDHKKEGQTEGEDSVDTEFDGLWMTRIVLPLKEEFHSDKKMSLSARFHDVHPSLLLFLHRLRSIAIVKDNEVQRMTRQDLVDDIIEINHSHGTDRWLVVKKQLKARDVREDVDMTELALAFPMPSDKESKNPTSTYIALPPQNVFAYLPLRSYGFKFIIQGDFEVPSSREDVDGDKAWNQWLREEIPKLFIEALEIFKKHPLFPGLSSVVKFFQFVPLEEEILDFFTPVSSAILKYLEGIPCLPVEKTEDGEKKRTDGKNGMDIQDYEWMQPCSVVVCDDPKIHAFITPSLLRKHLNLHYLAQEVSPAINPALRSKLGVQTLSAKHLIEIGRSVLKCSDSGPPDVVWIAHWLHCIHRSLESEHNSSSEMLNEIASMDIIPLSDNTFVNLKDNAVFFPLSNDHETTKSKKKKPKASYLQELERDLSVIHSDLLSRLCQVGHSQVQKLLQRLGVKSWSASEVIHEHILPTLKSDKWKSKSVAVLQSYLVYIFDQRLTDQSLCSMDELKDCCQVLTNDGPVNPSKKPIHFTPKYGNILNLRVDLSSISWTLLDDSYLDLSANHSARREDWERFFSDLGVGHFLAIERKTIKLTKMNLDNSPWALYYKGWPETSDGVYIVEDYCCSELEEFMEKPKDPRQAKVLAENLDKLWTTQYSTYAEYVPVTDTAKRKLQDTLSSFILLLRTKEWLPVVSPPRTFKAPRHSFADTPQLRSLLNEHVPYANVKLEEGSFVKAIELQFSISEEGLLEYLCGWSSKARTSVGQESEFVTSLNHMKAVYSYLHDNGKESATTKAKITSVFQKNPLIFVPKKGTKTPEENAQGGFYHLKEVCWNDPSEVTQRLLATGKYTPKRQILSQYYKESHDFLRLHLRVDQTPHTDEYIEMAAVLVDENPLPTPAVLESIFEIFAVLGEKCLKDTHQPSYNYMHDANFGEHVDEAIDLSRSNYIQTKLQQEAIFPCGDRWVALADKPIVPDNKQLKKIFEQENDVHFITLENSTGKSAPRKVGSQKRRKRIDVFLQACGIPKLSDIIEEELTPKNVEYQCHEVQLYFHKIVPCIQRYLYSNLEERYKDLKRQSFVKKLSEMIFATVEKLEVVYHLKGHPAVTVVQENKCGFHNIGQALHLYVVRQQSKSTESLNKEINKLFTASSVHFGNFLSRLNTKLDDGLENFLEEQEIDPLPDHEEKWFIPEPEIPSSPEPETLDSFEPPSIRRVTHSEDDGNLHCWPPRSSSTGIKPSIYERKSNQPKPAEIWAVPEAPDSMRNQAQSLDGSRLPSYISTVPDQSKLETKTNDFVTQNQKVPNVDDGGKSKQFLSSQDTHIHQKQEHRPLIPGENTIGSVDLPEGVSQDSTGEARAERGDDVHSTPQIIPPHSTPRASTQENVLGVFSPGSQASSTPKTGENVTAVFSPGIQVTFEEYDPEELLSGSEITLPLNVSLNDSSDKSEIGRWGEQFLYEYLKQQIQPESKVEVKWVNEHINSTSPYDIEIINKDVHGIGPDIVTYVEVKSTSAEDKEYFEISVPELRFGLEKRDAFHLYRVFNVGDTKSIRIVRVQNLASHLETKKVKMFIVI